MAHVNNYNTPYVKGRVYAHEVFQCNVERILFA